MNALVHRFAEWYLGLSPTAAAIIAVLIFLAFCAICVWWAWWRDPLKVEMRAIRRKRRFERQLLAHISQLRTERIAFSSRDCFRDMKGITK